MTIIAYLYNDNYWHNHPDCLPFDPDVKVSHQDARGRAPEEVMDDEPPFDTPQHCTTCGDLIELDLSLAGEAYVSQALRGWITDRMGDRATLRQWWDYYGSSVLENDDAVEMLAGLISDSLRAPRLDEGDMLVEWSIELTADNPVTAARTALRMHRDPGSIAAVFTVTDREGRRWEVDLDVPDYEPAITTRMR